MGEEDELLDLTLETGQELQRFDDGEDDGGPATIWTSSGDAFFTATHALWIDTVLPPPSVHGTLVAVPNRHTVLFHPIRDLAVVGAVRSPGPMARAASARACAGFAAGAWSAGRRASTTTA